MSKELFVIVGFFLLVLILLYTDANRKVNIHVCESDNVTRYIDLNDPPENIKFGDCRIEVMKMREYRRIKNSLTIRMR
jgi:hypothetical protein